MLTISALNYHKQKKKFYGHLNIQVYTILIYLNFSFSVEELNEFPFEIMKNEMGSEHDKKIELVRIFHGYCVYKFSRKSSNKQKQFFYI